MSARRIIVLALAVASIAAANDNTIINGTLDTTHQAVGAWIHGSKCTGTIIHRSGSTAWVLTAAHCVNGVAGEFRQGNDLNSPDRTYPVGAWIVHPDFNATGKQEYDFALLSLSGADAATPVIPPMTPIDDLLEVDRSFTTVGYGIIEGGGTSSLRRKIVQTILELDSIGFSTDQASGGFCSGDSGAPALVAGLEGERVAGAASYVSQVDCLGLGFLGRVSAVYNDFIALHTGLPPVELIFRDGFETLDAPWSDTGGVTSTCNQPDCTLPPP